MWKGRIFLVIHPDTSLGLLHWIPLHAINFPSMFLWLYMKYQCIYSFIASKNIDMWSFSTDSSRYKYWYSSWTSLQTFNFPSMMLWLNVKSEIIKFIWSKGREDPDLSARPCRNWPALEMRGLLLLLFWCPCWAGRCIPRICVGQLQQEEEQEHLEANAATPIPSRGGSAAGPTSAKRIVKILHYENCRIRGLLIRQRRINVAIGNKEERDLVIPVSYLKAWNWVQRPINACLCWSAHAMFLFMSPAIPSPAETKCRA